MYKNIHVTKPLGCSSLLFGLFWYFPLYFTIPHSFPLYVHRKKQVTRQR